MFTDRLISLRRNAAVFLLEWNGVSEFDVMLDYVGTTMVHLTAREEIDVVCEEFTGATLKVR